MAATPVTLPIEQARGHAGLSEVLHLGARVLAVWFGALSLLNTLAAIRNPAFDPNIWWIDLRFLPDPVGGALMAAVGTLLLAHGVRPSSPGWRRTASIVVVAVVELIVVWNVIGYYRVWGTGSIDPQSPVPLSLLIAILLGLVVLSMLRPAPTIPRRIAIATVAAVSLVFVVGLPLLQIGFFGTTDYRRAADAIVVFGARVRLDGTPSITLANRVLTASEVYREGLADTIVMTGGVEPTGFDETVVMRDLAVELGVPATAIVLDPEGDTTSASVTNTTRILRDRGLDRVLAVSQFYHLPRIKLAYATAGVEVWTVPARTTSIQQTKGLITREIPAFWLYYLRAVLG
ncbi:MAG: YdcF family protein [Actinomycetota bacterium]